MTTETEFKSDPIPPRDNPVQIELKDEQFKSIMGELQKAPQKNRLDTANKWLDVITKVFISVGVGFISAYIGCKEHTAKRNESTATSFANLFAEKEETRLGAAATAANDLSGDELKNFVRLALDRFTDKPPSRDYAEQGVINMAKTCYDKTNKIPLIMDVMAEGLGKERDAATKERAAEVVDRIGWPTASWVGATIPLLNNGAEQLDVRIKVCTAIGSLKWDDASAQALAPDISKLRKTLDGIAQNPQQPEGMQIACKGALQELPRQ